MSYFPLDRDLLTSSMWAQGSPQAVKVWIYLLLEANPRTGIVDDADPGVALRCGLSLAETVAALDWLSAPDEHSRTKDHDGRRIARLPDSGGIRVLNYLRRMDKDYSTVRVRSWRERKRDATKGNTTQRSATVKRAPERRTRTRTRTLKQQTTDLPADAGQPEAPVIATNWNREAVDDFRAAYSSDPPKQFLAQVKAVAQKFGWTATRPALGSYMDETPEYQYLNIPKVLAVKIQQEQNGHHQRAGTAAGGSEKARKRMEGLEALVTGRMPTGERGSVDAGYGGTGGEPSQPGRGNIRQGPPRRSLPAGDQTEHDGRPVAPGGEGGDPE